MYAVFLHYFFYVNVLWFLFCCILNILCFGSFFFYYFCLHFFLFVHRCVILFFLDVNVFWMFLCIFVFLLLVLCDFVPNFLMCLFVNQAIKWMTFCFIFSWYHMNIDFTRIWKFSFLENLKFSSCFQNVFKWQRGFGSTNLKINLTTSQPMHFL